MGERTVRISDVQLQKKINQRLSAPISVLKIFDVSLSHALVSFDSKAGRIKTTLDAHVKRLASNQSFAGKISISGQLRFDDKTQSIVLDDSKLESIHLDGLDAKYGDLLTMFGQKLGGDMLNGLLLYTMHSEDLKIGTTQYRAKEMRVTDQGLEMSFSPVK